MLQSRVFAARPRSGSMLRYFVEESLRNGLTPITQRLLAVHALGFEAEFSPSRSADVRVKVGRLRRAIERYYAGPGRSDPVVLAVSQGPYRLLATIRETAPAQVVATAARDTRRGRPILLVVEPEVRGMQRGHTDISGNVSLRLMSYLIEGSIVTVSGPLLRDRMAATASSAAALAAAFGYDFAAESEICISDRQWLVRMAVIDTTNGEPAGHSAATLGPFVDVSAATDAVAAWIFHRIGDHLSAFD